MNLGFTAVDRRKNPYGPRKKPRRSVGRLWSICARFIVFPGVLCSGEVTVWNGTWQTPELPFPHDRNIQGNTRGSCSAICSMSAGGIRV
jgi:hypothetical protein